MTTDPKPTSKNRSRMVFAAIAVGVILFQIVKTELRVSELRSQGFTDVVTSSTRNHAYFPLIGAIVGALLFTGIGIAVRRLLAKRDQ